ncbi:hypothetical protein ABVT39_017408 [Epinephelus coioides]
MAQECTAFQQPTVIPQISDCLEHTIKRSKTTPDKCEQSLCATVKVRSQCTLTASCKHFSVTIWAVRQDGLSLKTAAAARDRCVLGEMCAQHARRPHHYVTVFSRLEKMDKITEEISWLTERELTSPLSPKRPRMDYTMTNNHSGQSRFDFPELLTSQKTIDSPSSTSALMKKERENTEDEKPHEQLQDSKLIVTSVTKLNASHIDNECTGSSQVCFISAERCFQPLVKDEQPPVTATDEHSSYPVDDAGGALAESHTSKDASADTSSHSDCKQPGKSLEDKPPVGYSLPAGNEEDWRQVQNSVSQIEPFILSSGEHAAGKMIATAPSETVDRTTETPMPARISQAPAEGDNDASPFSVIDPAMWSETDRKAEENHRNSESTAGVELSPSVKVSEMETPLPLCSDVRLSQEVSVPDQTKRFNHQSKTEQCKDEKEESWQSYTEPQACSVSTNETHNKTGNKGSCHWRSSLSSSPCRPAKPSPAGDGRQESHDTVGHELKEQDQSGCFPVSPNHPETQEVEYLQTEIARMAGATEIREREEMTSSEEEIGADEHGKLENLSDSEEKLPPQNQKHTEDATEISTGDCDKLSYRDDELEINLECLSDHSYNAVISTKEGTTEEKERKEEAGGEEEMDVHGNSEILVKSEDDHQPQSQQKGDMTEESISECSEGNMCRSGHKSTLLGQHEQENKLSCFSDCHHRAETFMAENKDDFLAVMFPPTSDAVVPGPHELLHSQNADKPTALNCNDRFSPVPSAFTFNNSVSRGFDTFERIQLTLDDDDAGLSNSPLLTSLPGQLLKSPQRQVYDCMPEAESNEHNKVPEEEEEEEVERFECHTENMAKGFLSSDTSCNELPNFISAANVLALGQPEPQPNCESAYNSSECFQGNLNPKSMSSTVSCQSNGPASDVNDRPEFEMKKQFDMVLKELNLFFDISRNDFASNSRASSPERFSSITEALEGDTTNCKEHFSSPELGRPSSDANEDHSLEMCGGDPVVSFTSGSGDGEQEVPLGSQLCQETSVYTVEEQHKGLFSFSKKRQKTTTCIISSKESIIIKCLSN